MTWTSTPVSIPSAAEPLVDNLLSFTRSLRRAGLPIAPEQTRALLTALDLVELTDREQVYHAARSMLVFRQQDLQLFDLLFQRFFRSPSVAAGRPRKASRTEPPTNRARPPCFRTLRQMVSRACRRLASGMRSSIVEWLTWQWAQRRK